MGGKKERTERRIYKIHPAFGIARVGNADADRFFIGPEIPGQPATGDAAAGTTVPPYKADNDANEKIKPQAVRFRIWEYERNADGKYEATREINLAEKDVRRIKWTVHLANRKASFHMFRARKGETGPPAKLRNDLWPDESYKAAPMPASRRKTLLDIDPGARSITGKNKKGVEFSADGTGNWPIYPDGHDEAGKYVIDYLGELRTDAAGRLIVIGGKGRSRGLFSPGQLEYSLFLNYDNYWWFDDVSDGPVTAELEIEIDGRTETVTPAGAWIVVGPPDYAPHMPNVVTLYDLLFDLAVWDLDLPTDEAVYDGALKHLRQLNDELRVQGRDRLEDFIVDVDRDIEPLLQRARNMRWLTVQARDTHSILGVGTDNAAMLKLLHKDGPEGTKVRCEIFGMIRRPEPFKNRLGRTIKLPRSAGAKGRMPPIRGDNREYDKNSVASLTRTQYLLLEWWSRGVFARGSGPKAEVTPHDLDQAALEWSVGAGLHPGIEVGWQIRHPGLFAEPFRIDHAAKDRYWGKSASRIKPGHFTRQMAVPWQSDFYECSSEITVAGYQALTQQRELLWWPATVPDHVKPEAKASLDESESVRKVRVDWFRPSKGGYGAWPTSSDDEERKANLRFFMVSHWHKLGFVVRKDDQFLETERYKNNFP